MLVGHLGAGLAAKAVEPKLGLGTLFGAALLLDAVLWIFVLTGTEAATVPADYATRHYLYFNFPYSHSLLAALLWSVVAALAWAVFGGQGEWSGRVFSRGAIVIALVVYSHWALDFLVHPRQLPIAPGGPTLGLGLWDAQPLGLEVELAIAAIGLGLYLTRSGVAWGRRVLVIGLTLAVAAFTVWGAYAAGTPPAMSMLAYVSLLIIGAIIAAAAWADRAPLPVPVNES